MKTKKLIAKILLPLLILFSLGISSCSKQSNKDLSIAFYKISNKTADGLEKSINEIYKDKAVNLSFTNISDEKDLKNLVHSKKIDFVLTSAGNNQRICSEIANKNSGITGELEADLTSSLSRKFIIDDNKIIAAPILTDNYEIDINTYDFTTSKVKAINTWNDIEEFLIYQKRTKNHPLFFAGADTISFFDMLGALCEAIDGQQYYQKALEILDKGGDAKTVAYDLLGSSTSPMVNTGNLLKSYFRKGYISPDCFNYNIKDLERYAEENDAKMMMMSLSEHRTMKYNAISRYSSAYVPSDYEASYRVFTSNVLYLVPVKKYKESIDLLNKLLSNDNQSILSKNTGLAPITRTARVPDKQADDARFWVAATNPPVAGLGHDTKLSEEELKRIKDCIKTILLYE